MQNLFEFNQLTGYIALNKPWISMVPEFKDILVKSKPVRGDMDGRKKIHAFRIFTFIYMLVDFKSPLRDMTDEERYKEALRCSELVETDITEQVKKATAIYELYQENCARSLRTLKSMRRSLDQLDKYFETIDFTKTDKKGELLHSAKEYQANMKGVKDTYQSYEEFEERVHKELMAEATVREEGKRPDVAAARMLELVNDIFGKSVDIEDDEDPGSSFPEIEEDEIPNQQEEEE
jgi:hypothetical protein